jgi:hypothetical protein
MKSIEEIQTEIEALPHQEYMKLVHWFTERDWQSWDHELQRDSKAGKLDFLIEEAMAQKKNNSLGEM